MPFFIPSRFSQAEPSAHFIQISPNPFSHRPAAGPHVILGRLDPEQVSNLMTMVN